MTVEHNLPVNPVWTDRKRTFYFNFTAVYPRRFTVLDRLAGMFCPTSLDAQLWDLTYNHEKDFAKECQNNYTFEG